MILTKLELHNFGVYGGHQTFDLSPDDVGRSIILVGALNGGGKTTLLTAIQLVLYGPRAPSARAKKQSYEIFLKSKINRSAGSRNSAAIKLEFTMSDDEGECKYAVLRHWGEAESGRVKEELLVEVDGAYSKFLTENWAEHIETLLPERIMPLFFFDGEKIEELANEDNTSEILSSAVKGLLGLDLVDRLTSDLDVFEHRKMKSLASRDELVEIDAAQDGLKSLQEHREQLKQDRGAVSAKLERQQGKYREAKAEYANQGGDIFEQREKLKLDREDAILKFSEHADETAKISEGVAPLLLVRDLLGDVLQQSDHEEASEKAEAVLDLLSDHDRKTIIKLTELGILNDQIEGVSAYLASERETHEETANQGRHLSLSKNGYELLHVLDKSVLRETTRDISDSLEINSKFVDEIDQIEKLLLAVPENEVIEPYRLAVEAHEKKNAQYEDEIRYADARIQEQERKIESAGRDLRLKMSKNIDAQLDAEDAARFIKHSEKVKVTLEAFKITLLRKKLGQLEAFILECFNELTRKSQLIGELTIDPKTFEMRLKGGDMKTIEAADLSAGERQLLATSILWGLSKASQRQIPTIIDTPLGRLDSSHRGTLCGRYFPAASDQVILLSTDEEVDERYFEILKPSINRTYRIDFDAEQGGSTVRDGYFF